MTTVALVAAKDAASTIAATVTALRGLAGVDEVWVVDDGSGDATASVARAAGARVLRCERNLGKGGALAAAVAATPHAGRYLLADADLGATAGGLAPLLAAEGDVVIGVLPSARGRGGFGTVKAIAAAGIQYGSGAVMQAPLSGQRVVRGELLRSLVLAPRFGVEVGMTLDALATGAEVREIPVEVDHHHRGRGVAGFAHRAKQGADVVAALASRLLSARQQSAAIVAVAVIVFAALCGLSQLRRAPAGEALPGASQVVLFALDGLGLDDASSSARPNLARLRRYAAVGALSVRTTDRRRLSNRDRAERPSLADAYASVGASARVAWAGSMAASRARARAERADSLPGALGDALRDAGKHTALVGAPRTSAAAAVVADRFGRVGTVVGGPLAFRAKVDAALRVAPVVLIAADKATGDAQLGEVFEVLPRGTLLLVFSPTPPGEDWALTPVFAASAGVDGPAGVASATTRRPGLGAIVDLAPTVLTALGVEVPAAMTGAALRVSAQPADLSALHRLEVDGAVRGRFFLVAAVGYTVIALAFYLAFIAALRRGVSGEARRLWRAGVCSLAAFPLASLLTGAVQHWFHVGGESPALLAVVSVALGAVAARLGGLGPAFALAAATVGIIVVDVAATGPLHAASILGYSIQTTGRYYGLPNASFAVFAASLFLVAAAVAGWRPTRPQATGATAVLAVGAAFVAAPWLGNDVGGTITLLPLGLAAAWAWFRRPFTRRVVAAGAALVIVALVGFAALDAWSGATHLGRAATSSSLPTTLTRRVESNLGLLVDQWWGFLSLALAAGSMVLLRRRPGLGDYLPAGSGLRVGAFATLAASLLGFAVNDSGPVVNVLCLVVLAPAIALSALAGPRRVSGPAG